MPTDPRAALALSAIEGLVVVDEHPEHAEALRLAHRFGLVRRPPGIATVERYRITARGRRWLDDPWHLETAWDVARERRRIVAEAVDAEGDLLDVRELADRLGVTARRVNQIRRAL